VFRLPLLACLVALAGAAHGAEPAVHDPTQPFRAGAPGEGGSAAGATQPRFKLTAVLLSPTRRVAIVNGKALQEGQRIGGLEVVKIDSRSVLLREGNKEFVVQLGDARVSAPRAEGDAAQ
jgi:hypothetical protein